MSFEKTLAEQTEVQLKRSRKMPIAYILGVVLLALFASTASGNVHLRLSDRSQFYALEDITTPGTPILWVLFAPVAPIAAWSLFYMTTRRIPACWLSSLLMAPAGIGTVFGSLVYASSGSSGVVTLTSLLMSMIVTSTPLIFGPLSDVVSEHIGVVNIAVEGDLLVGAFAGVMTASFFQIPYAGIIAAPLVGAPLDFLFAFSPVKYGVDQIIVGVVLDVFALGLTIFFYRTLMKASPQIFSTNQFSLTPIKIPLLAETSVIGPMLFSQTLLVYLTYLAIAFLAVFLYRFRWSLRLRACSEHPRTADTVGINVSHTRGRNAILASSLAGLGGAFFTIGSDLAFTDNVFAGNGYITLAAMILDRWHPLGATSAALIFGFTQAVVRMFPNMSPAIPSGLVPMIPYLVTTVAVIGSVRKSGAPATENIPYVK